MNRHGHGDMHGESHAPIASLDAPPPPVLRDVTIAAVTPTHLRLHLEDDRSERSIPLADVEIWLRPR